MSEQLPPAEPMILTSVRFPRGEKERLLRLAKSKGTTLSHAMREGARRFLVCPSCGSDDRDRRGTLYPVSERGFCQDDFHGGRCPTCESDDPLVLVGECADRSTRYGEGKRVRLRLVDPFHARPSTDLPGGNKTDG